MTRDTKATAIGSFSDEFLAEYEIRSSLGYGGMAEVYLARHKGLDRQVAIKVLNPIAFSTQESRLRFEQEGQFTAKLDHPNIVTLLSHGTDGDRPYLVFEYVPGRSLRDMLKEKRTLPLKQVIALSKDIGEALRCAHKERIIHRDLKPENVLMDEKGRAKVADFGLAKMGRFGEQVTQVGMIVGTTGYMAPEVIQGRPASTRSDIYSLGILIYEMISGALPFHGETERELLIKYIKQRPPSLESRGFDVPSELEELVARCLDPDPTRRFQDAGLFLSDLDRVTKVILGWAREDSGRWKRPLEIIRQAGEVTSTAVRKIQEKDRPIDLKLIKRLMGRMEFLVPLAGTLIAAAALILLRRDKDRPPVVQFNVSGEVTVIRGSTSALVKWKTNKPARTILKIWDEGRGEESSRVVSPRVRPDEKPPEPSELHRLQVTQMDPMKSYRMRIIFPDGSTSGITVPLKPAATADELIKRHIARYVGKDRLSVAVSTFDPLTCGLRLKDQEGRVTESWQTGEPSEEHTFEVPRIRPDGVFEVQIMFKEIEDVVNRPKILGPRALVTRFVTRSAENHGVGFRELMAGLLALPGTARSTRRAREADPDLATRVAQLEAEASQRIHKYALDLGVDLDQLLGLAPFYLADATVPLEDLWRFHRSLVDMEEADQLGRHLFEEDFVGFSRAYAPLLTVEHPDPFPHAGEDLLDPLRFRDPEISSTLKDGPLLLMNIPVWERRGLVDTMVSGRGESFRKELARAEILAKRMQVSPGWARIPLPAQFVPRTPRSLLAALVYPFPLDYRLHVRFSGGRVFTLTAHPGCRVPDDSLPAPSGPSRVAGTPLVATFPTRLLEGVTDHVEISLDTIQTTSPPRQIPHGAWVFTLLVGPAST